MPSESIPKLFPREYSAWKEMRKRCLNPNGHAFQHYGGRGISIYPEWSSFRKFFDYVGQSPGPGYSLDRYPDNNGNYEPGNVRWATAEEQARNKRTTLRITYNGKTQTLIEWANELGLPYHTLYERVVTQGWELGRAICPQRFRTGPVTKLICEKCGGNKTQPFKDRKGLICVPCNRKYQREHAKLKSKLNREVHA